MLKHLSVTGISFKKTIVDWLRDDDVRGAYL